MEAVPVPTTRSARWAMEWVDHGPSHGELATLSTLFIAAVSPVPVGDEEVGCSLLCCRPAQAPEPAEESDGEDESDEEPASDEGDAAAAAAAGPGPSRGAAAAKKAKGGAKGGAKAAAKGGAKAPAAANGAAAGGADGAAPPAAAAGGGQGAGPSTSAGAGAGPSAGPAAVGAGGVAVAPKAPAPKKRRLVVLQSLANLTLWGERMWWCDRLCYHGLSCSGGAFVWEDCVAGVWKESVAGCGCLSGGAWPVQQLLRTRLTRTQTQVRLWIGCMSSA